MIDRLQLVRAFTEESYPYNHALRIGYIPGPDRIDLYRIPDTSFLQIKRRPRNIPEETMIHEFLQRGMVEDYFMFRNGSLLTIHLKNRADDMIAQAVVTEQQIYNVDLFPQTADAADMIESWADELQNLCDDMGFAGKIIFHPDDRGAIGVYAGQISHFIEFWRIARQPEQSFQQEFKFA